MARTTANTAFFELTHTGCRFVNNTGVLVDLPGVHADSDYELSDDEIIAALQKRLEATHALPASIEYVIDTETLGHNGAVTRSAYVEALNELMR